MENQMKRNEQNNLFYGYYSPSSGYNNSASSFSNFYQGIQPNTMNNYYQQRSNSPQQGFVYSGYPQSIINNQSSNYLAQNTNSVNSSMEKQAKIQNNQFKNDPYGLIAKTKSMKQININNVFPNTTNSGKAIPFMNIENSNKKKIDFSLQKNVTQTQQTPAKQTFNQLPVQNPYSSMSQKQIKNEIMHQLQSTSPQKQYLNKHNKTGFSAIQAIQNDLTYFNNYKQPNQAFITPINAQTNQKTVNFSETDIHAYSTASSKDIINFEVNKLAQQKQAILNKKQQSPHLIKANIRFTKDKYDNLSIKNESELYNIMQQIQKIVSEGDTTKNKLIFLLELKKNYQKSIIKSRMKQQKLAKLLSDNKQSTDEINRIIENSNQELQRLDLVGLDNWKQILYSGNEQFQFDQIVQSGKKDPYVMMTYNRYTDIGASFSSKVIKFPQNDSIDKSNVSIKLTPGEDYYPNINLDNLLQSQTKLNPSFQTRNEQLNTLKSSKSVGNIKGGKDALLSSIRSNKSNQKLLLNQYSLNVVSPSKLHNTPIFNPNNNPNFSPHNNFNNNSRQTSRTPSPNIRFQRPGNAWQHISTNKYQTVNPYFNYGNTNYFKK